jgi:signal transduction histidine kinase
MNDRVVPQIGAERRARLSPLTNGRHVSGYFFDELKQYVGFDEADEERLEEARPYVEPHYGEIVAAFYDALNANPRSAAVFSGPDQVERLRGTLHRWMAEAFEGPWDHDYFLRRMQIGKVHVDVGLMPHFMGGAMNIIRRHVVRLLFDEAEMKVEHLEAVERLLDLELTIMMQSYWDHMMDMKLKVPLALATGLAHEIRNPLNAIGLNLTLLERKLRNAGAEESAPIVDAVRSEVRRISTLTTEIMDFAKPVDIRPTWHDVDALLSQLQSMHGATFDASNIEFETSAEGGVEIWCDIDRLRQALMNLLANAVEATGSEGRVSVAITNDDHSTTIEVSDTGEGMEPAVVYQIFDLFFTRKATGTGLGLPIVKNIVDSHGGTIDVTSKPGVGTTFTIRLPRPVHERVLSGESE